MAVCPATLKERRAGSDRIDSWHCSLEQGDHGDEHRSVPGHRRWTGGEGVTWNHKRDTPLPPPMPPTTETPVVETPVVEAPVVEAPAVRVGDPIPQYDEKGNFEGYQPRECGEHRTVGTYRAWCHGCGEWCYPRLAAACSGCRHPVIEKMLDDMGAFLIDFFNPDGSFMLQEDTPVAEVVELIARFRAYKESE